MSWIAVSDAERRWSHAAVFGPDAQARYRLQTRGSIVIETRLSPEGRPQTLLGYERRHPWAGRISFQAVPGGGVVVILAQGDAVFHSVVPPESEERTDTLRLTFSWDAPARWGRLTVERPESDRVRMLETPPPPPLMLEDLYTMIERPELCERDRDVIYCAISDAVEPVGPMPSLTAGTPVETLRGPRRADALRPGDRVLTLGGAQEVVAVVTREVPAMGAFAPVTLRAPYLGLTRDITIAPQQRLVIGGSDVEYLFGREAVLIPAEALANGFTGYRAQTGTVLSYVQVVLARHDALRVAGAGLESLYLGRLRRDRALRAASLFAGLEDARFPEHLRAGYQTLRPFEAVTLAEARAA
ncbi:Hint domain-containing protein [Roseivivax sp.]